MSLVTRVSVCITNTCHSAAGCLESVTLPHKAEHEAGCQYREVICQYEHHGCQIRLTVKVRVECEVSCDKTKCFRLSVLREQRERERELKET